MRRMVALALGVFAPAVLIAATTGYHIIGEVKIGGEGGWDYLTVDSAARRLYVSHATHVAVVDADGTIVTVNRAWRDAVRPAGLLAQASVGANYLDLCADAVDEGFVDADAISKVVLRVLDGQEPSAETLYSERRADADPAAEAWFALRATRCEGPAPLLVVVTHEDVTADRRAQARETALMTERGARAAAEAVAQAIMDRTRAVERGNFICL